MPLKKILGRLTHLVSLLSGNVLPKSKYNQTVMFELTNACNFSCKMCGTPKAKRKKGMMSFDIFKLGLKRCHEAGIKNIKLYTFGEPLLHPQFTDFLTEAVKQGFHVSFSTNGYLLQKSLAEKILRLGVNNIQISFSGYDEESYSTYYDGDKFKQVKTNLANLGQILQNSKKTKISVNGIVPAENKEEYITKTKQFFDEIDLSPNALYLHTYNNFGGRGITQSDPLNINFCGKPLECTVFQYRLGVLFDGRITACPCLDVDAELVIGDIKKDTFKKCREAERYKSLERSFAEGDLSTIPMCKDCNHVKLLKCETI